MQKGGLQNPSQGQEATKPEEKSIALEICKEKINELIADDLELLADQSNLKIFIDELLKDPKNLANVTAWVNAVLQHAKFNELTSKAKSFILTLSPTYINLSIETVKDYEHVYWSSGVENLSADDLIETVRDLLTKPKKTTELEAKSGSNTPPQTTRTPRKSDEEDYVKITPPTTPDRKKESKDLPLLVVRTPEEDLKHIFYSIFYNIAVDCKTSKSNGITWGQYQKYIEGFFIPEEIAGLREFYIQKINNDEKLNDVQKNFLSNLLFQGLFPVPIKKEITSWAEPILDAINRRFANEIISNGGLNFNCSVLIDGLKSPIAPLEKRLMKEYDEPDPVKKLTLVLKICKTCHGSVGRSVFVEGLRRLVCQNIKNKFNLKSKNLNRGSPNEVVQRRSSLWSSLPPRVINKQPLPPAQPSFDLTQLSYQRMMKLG